MKNLLWAIGAVLVAVVLSLLLQAGIKDSSQSASLGAVTSPSTNLDYLQLSQALGWLTAGNPTPINQTMLRQTLTAATTTPCAIQNPFNATSTVPLAFFNVTTGTSTASSLTFATSSTAFATTSSFATFAVGASQQQTVVFNGLASGIGPVVGPNQWLVVGAAGVPAGGFTYGGSCAASFVSVS